MKEYCKDITSEELTRNFEKKLEAINNDKTTQDNVVQDAETEVKVILADINKNESEIGGKLYDAYQESRVIGTCACGGNLVTKYSPRNKSHFVGCTNYPDCKVTYSLPKGANFLKKTCPKCGLPIISFGKPRQHACLDPNCGKDNTKKRTPEIVGVCPDCGKELVKRSGRYGDFVGCKGFPKCRFTCSLEELKDLENKSKK